MLALSALAGTAQTPPPALTDVSANASLFRSVCLEGTTRLSSRDVETVPFARLPAGARDVLGQTMSNPGQQGMDGLLETARASDVPNRILLVRSRSAYLLTPQTDAKGALASSCVVIWRGDDGAAAARTIVPNQPLVAAFNPSSNSLGFAQIRASEGDLTVTVSARQGWIAMRSAPAQNQNTENPGQ